MKRATRIRIEYQWGPGCHLNGIDPNEAGLELKRLTRSCAGVIRAEDVVRVAEIESSPLHPAFTWDDTKAADEYRKDEARTVLQSIREVITRDDGVDEQRRIFVHVVDGDTPGYRPLRVVMREPDLLQEVIAAAKSGILAWRARYAELQQFSEIHEAIDRTISGKGQSAAR